MNTARKDEILEKIVEYFDEESDLFNELIEELDCWSGYLGDDRYYSIWDFDELLNGKSPTDIASMVVNGDFNPGDDYFRFDGYGNIESSSDKDYTDYNYKSVIEDIIDELEYLDLDNNRFTDFLEMVEEYNEAIDE